MCCAEHEGEMPGGAMSAGPQGSEMGAGAPVGQGQTSTGAIEPELDAYLRERQVQTTALAPGQQGEMPGGSMGTRPQERQMGAMAPGQQGQMPGGGMGRPQESQIAPLAPTGQGQTVTGTSEPELTAYLRERQNQMSATAPSEQGEMPTGGMGAGLQENQMATMEPGHRGEMPGGAMNDGP